MKNLIALHNEAKTLNSKTAKPQICSRVLSTKLPLNPDPELPILPDCRSNKEWNKDKGRCGRSLACQSGCEQLHLGPLSPTEPRPLVPLGWKSNETQFHSSRGVSLRTSHTFKPCTRQEQTYIEDVIHELQCVKAHVHGQQLHHPQIVHLVRLLERPGNWVYTHYLLHPSPTLSTASDACNSSKFAESECPNIPTLRNLSDHPLPHLHHQQENTQTSSLLCNLSCS